MTSEVRGIVFDLYGTLVEDFPYAGQDRTLTAMTAALGVDMKEFKRQWAATYPFRELGMPPTIAQAISETCMSLGSMVSNDTIGRAVDILQSFLEATLQPKEESGTVLGRLKDAGLPLAVISNAPPGVPEAWEKCPLMPLVDIALFSCSIGLKKPGAPIYECAAERLGLPAEYLLFVGDGGNYELRGALDVGMKAVLLAPSCLTRPDPYGFFEESRTWTGLAVKDLHGLLRLIAKGTDCQRVGACDAAEPRA